MSGFAMIVYEGKLMAQPEKLQSWAPRINFALYYNKKFSISMALFFSCRIRGRIGLSCGEGAAIEFFRKILCGVVMVDQL